MPFFTGALIAILIVWLISVQRKLTAMNENINHAMSQIGIQLSSCFEALNALLSLTEKWDAHESQRLLENIRSRRSVIHAESTPKDVLEQEDIIIEALRHIGMVTRQYPELRADENYFRIVSAVDCYGKMVRTSRLIYNDSVTKLNRELYRFPTCLVRGMLGFQQRDYLEAIEETVDVFKMR